MMVNTNDDTDQDNLVILTAPLKFHEVQLNEVNLNIKSGDIEKNLNSVMEKENNSKGVVGAEIRRRMSFGDSEPPFSEPRTRHLALKSLSDTCLFYQVLSTEQMNVAQSMKKEFIPALIASNVDDDEEEQVELFCNCGCGMALVPELMSKDAEEDGEEEEEEDLSEDEGCYLLSGSQFTSLSIPENEAGVPKVMAASESQNNAATEIIPEAAVSGRSYSLSVDSGRSSNTGTLGHHSTSLSSKSSSSSTDSQDEQDNVKIVSHSFCDFVGSISNKSSSSSTSSLASQSDNSKPPTALAHPNKVTVFVPFSAISEVKKNEGKANKVTKEASREAQSNSKVTEVFSDNVVICDTQVILRINCQKPPTPSPSSDELEGKQRIWEENDSKAGNNGKLNKRMAKRMTTTVAVYEMINENKQSDQNVDTKEVTCSNGTTGKGNKIPSKVVPPRKKDLCKLLGLIECDIATDASNPEDIKVAQKLALKNLMSAIQAQHGQTQLDETGTNFSKVTTTTPRNGAKKDLAKFLGVDETEPAATSKRRFSSMPRAHHDTKSITSSDSSKAKLINWSQLMKSTLKWKISDNFNVNEGKAESLVSGGSLKNKDDLLDLQFHQLKSANEVIFGEQQRTNRKDLNKYLGLDDSDSEEMVFIQNKKRPVQELAGTLNGGSLNRSDQGSVGVSVVGIKIEDAETHKIEDETFDLSDTESLTSSLGSTLDSCNKKSSLNSFLQKSSRLRTTNSSQDQRPNRSMSVASASKDRFQHRQYAESEDNYSPSPQRKTVNFKEYNNFSVEESLAQGQPVIAGSLHSNSSGSCHIQRKKKKDAARRSAEVSLARISNNNNSIQHPRQRKIDACDQYPQPPDYVHEGSGRCEEEMAPISNCYGEHDHDDVGKMKTSHLINGKTKKKIKRGAMVRGHRLLPHVAPTAEHPPNLFIDPPQYYFTPQQQQQQVFVYKPYQPVHLNQPPAIMSCSPTGRIRLVRRPYQHGNIEKMEDLKKAFLA